MLLKTIEKYNKLRAELKQDSTDLISFYNSKIKDFNEAVTPTYYSVRSISEGEANFYKHKLHIPYINNTVLAFHYLRDLLEVRIVIVDGNETTGNNYDIFKRVEINELLDIDTFITTLKNPKPTEYGQTKEDTLRSYLKSYKEIITKKIKDSEKRLKNV